jgi:cyclohexa-1,5-dienecarbonyl-CoA hydratase
MSGAATSWLEIVERGGTRRITLRRPPLNVLDVELMTELAGALAEVAADADTKLLVLTGSGKAFCAGVDVGDHQADRVERTLERFHGVVRSLMALPCPVIAALNGHALGGGLELAMACDVVIASDRASLGQPEITLGVFPPVAAALLPRLIGPMRAMDLVLSGRTITAQEAQRIGLVSRVVPAEDFAREVDGVIAGFGALSGPVLRLTKRVVRETMPLGADAAIERAERSYLDELMRLRDPHEGIAAFLEKRQPVWSEG